MNKITLWIGGKRYYFAYSKDFRILRKRVCGGKEFYPFYKTAYWTAFYKRSKKIKTFRKADVVSLIKKKLKQT